MICFQLFEGLPPYWNMDPIEAARAAALKGLRPTWGATNKHDQVRVARAQHPGRVRYPHARMGAAGLLHWLPPVHQYGSSYLKTGCFRPRRWCQRG